MLTYLLKILVEAHTDTLHERLDSRQLRRSGALDGAQVLCEQEAGLLAADATRPLHPVNEARPIPLGCDGQLQHARVPLHKGVLAAVSSLISRQSSS